MLPRRRWRRFLATVDAAVAVEAVEASAEVLNSAAAGGSSVPPFVHSVNVGC